MSVPLIWSTTPSDNQTIDAAAQWPEGQPASSLNNSARGVMARLAMARDDATGTLVASVSSSNVYTLNTNQGLIDPASTVGGGVAKISKPFVIRAILPALSVAVATSAPTIVIDGAAAVPLVRYDGNALTDGDLKGVAYEILGDAVTAGAYSRARVLNLLPSDVRAIIGDTSGFPIGGVLPFTGSNTPTGFLVANGAVLSRASYPKLWAHAQASGIAASEADWTGNAGLYQGFYSQGDGSTTFRLPALNGAFLRGVDAGRGLDAGRAMGTLQMDALRRHNHVMANGGAPITLYGGPNTVYLSVGNPNNGYYADSIGFTGDAETRPVNVAYPFLIRAY